MPERLFALLLLLPPAAAAAAPGDARCGLDLARAEELVAAVARRDRGGPYGPSHI